MSSRGGARTWVCSGHLVGWRAGQLGGARYDDDPFAGTPARLPFVKGSGYPMTLVQVGPLYPPCRPIPRGPQSLDLRTKPQPDWAVPRGSALQSARPTVAGHPGEAWCSDCGAREVDLTCLDFRSCPVHSLEGCLLPKVIQQVEDTAKALLSSSPCLLPTWGWGWVEEPASLRNTIGLGLCEDRGQGHSSLRGDVLEGRGRGETPWRLLLWKQAGTKKLITRGWGNHVADM